MLMIDDDGDDHVGVRMIMDTAQAAAGQGLLWVGRIGTVLLPWQDIYLYVYMHRHEHTTHFSTTGDRPQTKKQSPAQRARLVAFSRQFPRKIRSERRRAELLLYVLMGREAFTRTCAFEITNSSEATARQGLLSVGSIGAGSDGKRHTEHNKSQSKDTNDERRGYVDD